MQTPMIGELEFLEMLGAPNPLGQLSHRITRPNVDGVAAQLGGKQSREFVLNTLADIFISDPDNAFEIAATVATYKDLQGTLVTVTLPSGAEYQNVLVWEVEPADIRECLVASGGLDDGTVILACRWVLECTEVPE